MLSGLNNLFSPVEHTTSQLYKLIDKMTVSEDWNCVDIINQSAKLKVFLLVHVNDIMCVSYISVAVGSS